MSVRSSTIRVLMIYAAVFVSVVTRSNLFGQNAPSSSIFTDSSIILSVSDVCRSVKFYESVLEFNLESFLIGKAQEVAKLSPSDPEPYAATMLAGNQHINLQKSVDSPRPAGARYWFRVKDAAAYYDRIMKQGNTVQLMAKDALGKPFAFSILDPDGHWFMFVGPVRGR